MKPLALILLAAAFAAASAQTTPKSTTTPSANPATPAAPAKTGSSTTNTASATAAAKPSTVASAVPPWIKLPPGVPVAAHHGPVKMPFAMRYEDIAVGNGPLAEPHKIYRVRYTGWLAADGHKFDSSDDHPPQPIYDSSLKQVMGDDGKPKMEAGQPILFMQGRPGMISGWDMGFEGMRVGGKRRLFIPYQLAYGELGRPGPDPKNPGIPPKADLIFDIQLVEMLEPPAPPMRPGMPGGAPGAHPVPVPPRPGAGTPPAAPAAPSTPRSTGAPPASAPPAAAAPPSSAVPAPAQPAQPATPPPATTQPQPAAAPAPQPTAPAPQK